MIALAAVAVRSRRNAAALTLAVGGVYLLTDAVLVVEPVGIALAVANALLFAAYIVLGHRVASSARLSGIDGLATAMLIAAAVALPIGAWDAAPAFTDPLALAAAVGVGVSSSVIPYVCDQLAMARLSRARYSLMVALLPATATVVGVVVLTQVPTLLEVLGVVLVVGGLPCTRSTGREPSALSGRSAVWQPGRPNAARGSAQVDELEQRRRRRKGQTADGPPDQEQDLGDRGLQAEREDVVADTRDDQAKVADRSADARDRAAEERDATADHQDARVGESVTTPESPAVRHRAREDRREAAHDREKAVDDRGRARRDRKTAKHGRDRASEDRGAAWDTVIRLRELLSEAEDNAEDMLLVGQAQGLIMKAREVGAAEALLELCARAIRDQSGLGEASRSIVAESSP